MLKKGLFLMPMIILSSPRTFNLMIIHCLKEYFYLIIPIEITGNPGNATEESLKPRIRQSR